MRAKFFLSTLLLLVLLSQILKAQKISEGQFEQDLIYFTTSEAPDTSSFEYRRARSKAEGEFSMTIAFKPDAIVLKKKENERVVIDLKNKLIFEFHYFI